MKPNHTIATLTLIAASALTALAGPEIVGVGFVLGFNEPAKTVQIMKILPNSPAAKAAVPEGSLITKIDDTPTAGKKIEECVSMIRGGIGTSVRVEVTNPSDNKSTQIELKRQKIETNP